MTLFCLILNTSSINISKSSIYRFARLSYLMKRKTIATTIATKWAVAK